MVILPVDMILAKVVLDKQHCVEKAKELLADKDTCRLNTRDPTSKHKNKLIQILRTIKAQSGLGDTTYKRLSNR